MEFKIAETFSEDLDVKREMNRVSDEIKNVLSEEIEYAENLAPMLESVNFEEDDLKDLTVGEFTEEIDSDVSKMQKELDSVSEMIDGIESSFDGDDKILDLLPGSNSSIIDDSADEDNADTDYVNDGDLSKFLGYITGEYPAKIPQHDGRSMSGCERAVSFLERLNNEISRAIREDSDSKLTDDIDDIEKVRRNIMTDILVLKDHLSKLKKELKESHSKKAAPLWIDGSGKSVDIHGRSYKKASVPNNIVISVTPFERAITGMMINATVSAGYDMEEVYEFLKDKYKLSDREELSVMQILADSGYHMFKDRGTFSSESDGDGSRGVDFMKNYFA